MTFVEFGLWCIVGLIVFIFLSIACFVLTGKSLLWRVMEFQHHNYALDVLGDAIIEARKTGETLFPALSASTLARTHDTIIPIEEMPDPEDGRTFPQYFDETENPVVHAYIELDEKKEFLGLLIQGRLDDGTIVDIEIDGIVDAETSPIYGWEYLVLDYLLYRKDLRKISKMVKKAVKRQDEIEKL